MEAYHSRIRMPYMILVISVSLHGPVGEATGFSSRWCCAWGRLGRTLYWIASAIQLLVLKLAPVCQMLCAHQLMSYDQ